MKPLVEELEKQYGTTVEFRKLNVETDQSAVELANKMGVQYVPTFLYVNSDGVVAKQVVGEQTREQLEAELKALK